MRGALLSLALATAAVSADPTIRLPSAPVVPSPMPAPVTPGVLTLDGESLYVIDCSSECAVRPHPANLVTVKKHKGPITIYSKFVGGSGQMEEKTFAGPFVYVLRAAGVGTVELDIIPFGFKSEADIVSTTVNVDSGQAPNPPPEPKPPEPKPPEPVKSFRVIFVYETSKPVTLDMQKILYGQDVNNLLDAKTTRGPAGVGWRRYDPNTDATNDRDTNMRALWNTVKPNAEGTQPRITTVPVWVIEVNGKADILPWPATQAEAVATINKYLGVK